MKKTLSICQAFCLLLVSAFFVFQANAQSSLFSVPTTDVMPKGETYVEADFDAHLTDYESGGFQSYGFSAIRGVGNNLEIGVNGYFVKDGDGWQPAEIQPNAKWKFYENEGSGVAVSGGVIAYIPLNKRNVRDGVGMFYGTVSKQFSGKYGPRLTGGAYQLAANKNFEGGKRGLLVGYEQPLTKKLYFIADWNSSKNRFGYSAAGFGYNLTKRSSLYAAYYFGNEGRGNNSLGIYYGYSF